MKIEEMNIEHVSCKEVANHICESLGEELNSPRCRAIKEHLETCQYCKDYFNSVGKTIEFYKKYEIELPKQAHDRLMDCLGLGDEK